MRKLIKLIIVPVPTSSFIKSHSINFHLSGWPW